MIGTIINFITGSRIARTIGLAIMAVLGVLTFGAVKKREGVRDAKAKRAAQDAKAHQKTIEEVLRETPSDDLADAIRQRMSKRARKP